MCCSLIAVAKIIQSELSEWKEIKIVPPIETKKKKKKQLGKNKCKCVKDFWKTK